MARRAELPNDGGVDENHDKQRNEEENCADQSVVDTLKGVFLNTGAHFRGVDRSGGPRFQAISLRVVAPLENGKRQFSQLVWLVMLMHNKLESAPHQTNVYSM